MALPFCKATGAQSIARAARATRSRRRLMTEDDAPIVRHDRPQGALIVPYGRQAQANRNRVRSCRAATQALGSSRRNRLTRRAWPITETEDRLIAAAAIIGLSSRPKNGYSTP